MATVLLLHCDGANTSTAVVDEVGHAITVNGNAQISTAQFKFGSSSLLFDGTGDYVFATSSSDFAFGTGDFTIEFWFYATDVTAEQFLVSLRNTGSGITNNVIRVSAGKLGWSNGTAWLEHSGTVVVNTWYHVAVTRASNTLRIFIDGASGYSGAQSIDLSTNRPAYIGASDSGSQPYNGYLDGIRVTKGEALYTANFTPPSAQFFYNNTVLYLPMDGSNASTTFTDATGKTVTANGNARISTVQSKFGGSSYLGDGSGDYLSVASSTDFDFLGGDFTVEFWCKNNNASDTGSACLCIGGSASNYWQILIRNTLSINSNNGTNRDLTASGYTLDTNWHHFAFVKRAGGYYIFWDGTSMTLTGSGPVSLATSFPVYIGASYNGGATSYNGYIDDLRICRSAKYTANFTPPTTAHEYEYTKLLIHADDANGATCVRSENGQAVTVAGNAQISTAQSVFGGSSALFDGTGDYLSLADSADWDFGTGDFTVELRVRFAAHTSVMTLVGNYQNSTTGWAFQYRSDAGGLRLTNGDTALIDATWSPSDGQWYHAAICRSGTSLRVFVDGVQVGTTATNSTNISGSANALLIGALNFGGFIQNFNGYLDEIRITKGYARYTTNFTPSTTAFFVQGQYTATISGLVRDDTGALCARTVRLYLRSSGALVQTTTSDGTSGAYTFQQNDTNEYYVVALDDASGTQYNALILDKVVPG